MHNQKTTQLQSCLIPRQVFDSKLCVYIYIYMYIGYGCIDVCVCVVNSHIAW